MEDPECGYEEMQGVRLGYLLIKGKQMFALSQVFTDLLKNIPRTTVHKRMDHLKVKKHHCDLEELRKLKAINSVAFHAAKCTLISREDVEALYFSCKTERVLKSNKRKAKAGCSPGDGDTSSGLLRANTELWKEKVWFSLHGVPETVTLHNKTGRRRELTPCLPDSKLPQSYNKSQRREYRSATKSCHKHFKNYETAKITGNRVTWSQRHSFFRSAVSRQPLVLQSAIAQSRLSRSAGDLLHKRKRRREGGGGRDSARHSWSRSRHAHHHVPPVLLVQPKSTGSHGTSFGAFHLGPDFYLDPRPHHHHLHQHHHHHHHHHHHEPSFPESYSSDTESSTYTDREYNDSDFGSGFSTSSNSGSSEEEDEGEDEDESHSESSEVSSEEEESSSHSDSSSVSSRVSVQSIRFRRARVGSLAKTLGTSKAPLVLQPTFHYNHQQQEKHNRTLGHVATSQTGDNRHEKRQKCEFTCSETRKDSGLLQPSTFNSTVIGECFFTDSKGEKASEAHGDPNRKDSVDGLAPYSPGPKRNKAFLSARRTPGHPTKCPPGECRSTQDFPCTKEGEQKNKNCRTLMLGKKPRVSKTQTKSNVARLNKAASSFCPEEGSTEDLPSRRKRSNASTVASPAKKPFSLMANFPSPPSLVVGNDGDLCPAYSMNSLRGPGPPPPSHPVWRWQPGSQLLPPPHAQRTRKY
ncbi:hypothetical protein LDENG_00028770 [Lucifuga dentata]|nr:hypothetical protein LDENG_00028770 [Lucifuga dentata]